MNKTKKISHWTKAVALALVIMCNASQGVNAMTQQISDEIYEGLPFQMNKIAQPVFPDYSCNITLNTDAINRAIEETSAKGGGKVIVPEGLWLTGPIVMKSNVNLHLETNALIVFTADHKAYPIVETSFEGLETRRCLSPLSAVGAENIAITGKGVIDGNGDTWRPVKKNKLTGTQWKKLVASGGVLDAKGEVWYPSEGSMKGAMACKNFNVPEGINTDEEWSSIHDWLRPVLLSFRKCKNILLEDVTFKNSPSWCLHPLSCENLTINRVTVSNPWYSQNGDAIDVESCNGVIIANSSFDAGDDGICIKSGKDENGRKRGEPCQNIIIKNNQVLHGHGGFVVGSEMSGGVKNIFVDNCTFLGTDVGLRFKSTRGRGGVVENIPAVTEETPAFQDIYISKVIAKGVGRAIYFNGLPEMPIKNIFIQDVTMSDAKDGVILRNAEGATLKNVKIETIKGGDNLKLQNVSKVCVDKKQYKKVGNKAESYRF